MTERRLPKVTKPSQKTGNNRAKNGDYEVGYGRPPRDTQFKKGQPRPPRKPKPEPQPSFEDWFEEELRLPMRFVDENGEEQVLPKGRVLAKTSVNKALKSGDIRQIREFIPRRPPRIDEEISKTNIEMVVRFMASYLGSDLADAACSGEDEDSGAADEEGGAG